jgi:uncharacterized membrane protein YhhN
MWIIILSVLMVISAALTISAEYHGPRRNVYVFKPLTVVFIILLALLNKYPVASAYKYLIVAGLVCSLAGDVFLMLPSDRFIHGLVSFLVAHLFYIAAFMLAGGRIVSVWAALPLAIHGGLMLWLLWPFLGKMKAPVIVYVVLILLMAWMAWSRYLLTRQAGSYLAAVGATLFVASDSFLAVNRFKGGFRSAQFLILSTYFAAQWLIALST